MDLSQPTPQSVKQAVSYTITNLALERTQIQLSNGNYLYDTDQGTDNVATPASQTDGTSIATAWFITEASDSQPLKVLTIGDSLTYGINQDLAHGQPRVAYRQALSKNLISYFGKVAFVGNVTDYVSEVDDDFLYRHSGYSGYVIEDVYQVENHPGIKPLVDDMMKKYQPDIVILMLGTNDLFRAMTVNEIIPRWENLVLQIEAQLPEDGLLICSSLPPIQSLTKEDAFNEKIQIRTRELAQEGYKVGFADPNTPLSQKADSYLNADGTHLNRFGYEVVGQVFTDAIQKAYKQDGQKVQPNPLIPADPNASADTESSVPDPHKGASSLPLLWPIIGAVVMAAVIVIVLLRRKK